MKKQLSLSAKSVQSTVLSCAVFGFIAQIIALCFFAYSLSKQYIQTANSTVKQADMSVTHGANAVDYSEQVMRIYRSLNEEERALIGTPAYRDLFVEIDTPALQHEYDDLLNILDRIISYHTQNDLSDIYIGMYDKETSALVYIVDADQDETLRYQPGDWEHVTNAEIQRFLAPKDRSRVLYHFGWTQKYGLLCTVGSPIISKQTGEISGFVLADISLNNLLYGMVEFVLGYTLILLLVTILIAWLRTRYIRKSILRPIDLISQASQQFASEQTEQDEPKNHFADLPIHTGDEIEKLAHTMAEMEDNLYAYGGELLKIAKEKEHIATELELARRIQADMLPSVFPPFPQRHDFEIYATMTPAKEVGGDFYDFFLLDDDHLGIVMADVSGEGVPAALFMMMSKILIANFTMQGLSPAKVLEQINDMICRNNKARMFVTVWLGILEISTGKILAVNAGHEYPIIRTADGDFALFKDDHSFVVGGMKHMKYKEYEMQLSKGGTLFLYTDGLAEAMDGSRNMFGTDRLIEVMNRNKNAAPDVLLSEIMASVDAFAGDAEQFDDLTMLGITLR